jgi:predicted glycoside hydrolase/deacetylase ChbG (UPF0249 family)
MHEPVRRLSSGLPETWNLAGTSELLLLTRFYGQTVKGLPLPTHISLEWLVEFIDAPTGWTVLTCHPGYVDQEELNTMYRLERYEELKVLCHPRIRAVIDGLGIRLSSFDEWNCSRAMLKGAEQ